MTLAKNSVIYGVSHGWQMKYGILCPGRDTGKYYVMHLVTLASYVIAYGGRSTIV